MGNVGSHLHLLAEMFAIRYHGSSAAPGSKPTALSRLKPRLSPREVARRIEFQRGMTTESS
jgi:hypothetical protein